MHHYKSKTSANLHFVIEPGPVAMKQVVIENPVLNSPFEEPKRHFRFAEDGITDDVVEARRVSSYFVPIPRPKKKNPKQLAFETEWTADRIEENRFINQVRERVSIWRRGGYVGITRMTARLLEYWQMPEWEKRLFFWQMKNKLRRTSIHRYYAPRNR
jgi:type III restriction enzyme